jgi:hypothetical protein
VEDTGGSVSLPVAQQTDANAAEAAAAAAEVTAMATAMAVETLTDEEAFARRVRMLPPGLSLLVAPSEGEGERAEAEEEAMLHAQAFHSGEVRLLVAILSEGSSEIRHFLWGRAAPHPRCLLPCESPTTTRYTHWGCTIHICLSSSTILRRRSQSAASSLPRSLVCV